MEQFQFVLSFKIPDLDQFDGIRNTKPCPKEYCATLEVSESSIEVIIPYESGTYLGHKFFFWMQSRQKRNLGHYLIPNREKQNPDVISFDFSLANMVGGGDRGIGSEGSSLSIKLDWIKVVWEPDEKYENRSRAYLNPAGFRFTSQFYTVLFYNRFDEEFTLKRFSDDWFPTQNCLFKPKQAYNFGDKKESTDIHISKNPYIELKDYSCDEPILVNEIRMICALTSFYYHEPIEPNFLWLQFPDRIVSIRQLPKNYLKAKTEGFFYAGYYRQIKDFLAEAKLDFFYNEPGIALHIIEKFIISGELRGTSKFLLLYNLLEILRNRFPIVKRKASKHQLQVSQKAFWEKWATAEKIILESFEEGSRQELHNKLENFKGHLPKRNVNNPIKELLVHCKLSLEEFPVTVEELTRLRSDIIHGSLSKALDTEYLEKANHILHRTVAIIILRLLGITDTKLTIDSKYR